MIKTNCSCRDKTEEWTIDQSIPAWYVIRTCSSCGYYWEGPDYSKVVQSENHSSQFGEYKIYCYDKMGHYGTPRYFDMINDIFDFCELNKYSHHMIRVMDRNDHICIEAVGGYYEFPKEWEVFNVQ